MGCGQSTPGQVWAQPQNPQINGIAQQQGGAVSINDYIVETMLLSSTFDLA